jgi:hypothetical protein
VNRRPAGWSQEQLEALNDLVDAQAAFRTVDQVMSDAGDFSPEAGAIWADLLAHQADAWARLKSFPAAP